MDVYWMHGWVQSSVCLFIYHWSPHNIVVDIPGFNYVPVSFFRNVFDSNISLEVRFKFNDLAGRQWSQLLLGTNERLSNGHSPTWWEDGEGGPTWFSYLFLLTLSVGQGAWKRQSICAPWRPIRPLRWKPAWTFWKLYHQSGVWRMYRSSVNVNSKHPHTNCSTVGIECF